MGLEQYSTDYRSIATENGVKDDVLKGLNKSSVPASTGNGEAAISPSLTPRLRDRWSCCCRLAIGVIGVLAGVITLMPNIMFSSSGSSRAMLGANIGLCASLAFVVGGIIGALRNEGKWLLVGLVLQLVAFLVVGF